MELLRLFLEQPAARSVVNAKVGFVERSGTSFSRAFSECECLFFQMLNGNTALHVASSLRSHRRQVEAARALMGGGADPDARNLENEVPSQLVPRGAVGRKVGGA